MTARFRELPTAIFAVVSSEQRTGNPHALEYTPGLTLPHAVTELQGADLDLEAVCD